MSLVERILEDLLQFMFGALIRVALYCFVVVVFSRISAQTATSRGEGNNQDERPYITWSPSLDFLLIGWIIFNNGESRKYLITAHSIFVLSGIHPSGHLNSTVTFEGVRPLSD